MVLSTVISLCGTLVFSQVSANPTGAVPGSVNNIQQSLESTAEYAPLLPQEEDTFATYAYTLSDIIVFSYADDAQIEIWNEDRTTLHWSGTLNQDEFHHQYGSGIYQILSSREFSVLIGDPISNIVQGWTAVDQRSKPLSTKLLTVVQGSWVSGSHTGTEIFNVFAYYDNTHVVVRNLNDGTQIWEGDLDSLEYWQYYNSIGGSVGNNIRGLPISIEASKEVSAISYGDCGYYLPAFNGTFTGRDFIGYLGDMSDWPQSLKIIPWEDDVNITVTDLNEPTDTIWKLHIEDRGRIEGKLILRRWVKIEADKDISCAFVPGQGCYYHLLRAIDRNGLGIGTEFFIPTLGFCSSNPGDPNGQLDIFSFYDNNQVEVRSTFDNTFVWSGTLNEGDHHRIMTMTGAHTVTSTRGVAVIESAGGQAGADFLPLWFAIHPAVATVPTPQFCETECLVSTMRQNNYQLFVENNGNSMDVINISTTHTEAPDFTSEVTDILGNPLPDADGNSQIDTDSLPASGRFEVLVNVTPADKLPFGTTDTCIFAIQSTQDTARMDTAFLITTIREIEVEVTPVDTLYVYPGNVGVFNLETSHNSLYREDNINFSWSTTQPEAQWTVILTDISGNDLQDNDGDGNIDLPSVPVNQEPSPFQLRVQVPDDANAGDEDVVTLVTTSYNYPADYPGDIYGTVIDTGRYVVIVEPVPDILIEEDQTGIVDAGRTIRYGLEVFNFGNTDDVPNITYQTDQVGWTHTLISSNGTDPIVDNNADGIPDVGLLPRVDGSDSLFLDVDVPWSAVEGEIDSTIVYARSTVTDTVYDSVVIVTTVDVSRVVDIAVWPDQTTIIHPGDSAIYELQVANHGEDADPISIGSNTIRNLNWDTTFTFANNEPLDDYNNDGQSDLNFVEVLDTVSVKMVVRPPEELGSIIGEFDTTVVEQRYVWIQTGFEADTIVRDSALLTTILEPEFDIHNYPNPFTDKTTFAYTIPRGGLVTLRIYNRAGEYIRTLLLDEELQYGGIFKIEWDGLTEDGKEPSPGIYIYALEWRERKEDDSYATFKKRIVKKALLQP
ncbi:hypothetical protein GF359_09150 [candidate division WOR-3 bacterium]|uniref:FlgD Ig-like domain-containing protein n=1 Tax=candidate division WOR-3 bacterium TaxID=2052148 RepID=A0A9D5KC61_UNCW3|nr:hypothetical protein [candidate division WOR-3 bacterium]MBD3365365.1 hypothetical protein [candidate division WOR-3 bacterium]